MFDGNEIMVETPCLNKAMRSLGLFTNIRPLKVALKDGDKRWVFAGIYEDRETVIFINEMGER